MSRYLSTVLKAQLSELMCFHIKCSARYSTIVRYQLLYHHHGRSQGGTWAMVPKIYHFHHLPLILPII